MRVSEESGRWNRHNASHRVMGYFKDMNPGAASDRDGGKFEANKTGADDNDVVCYGESLLQHIRIGECPQWQNPIEISAGYRKRPVMCASGKDEVVPRKFPTRPQLEAAFLPIDRGHGITVDEVDLLLGVEFSRPQPQLIDPRLTGEVGFRQRRALVRYDGLVTNQCDTSAEAFLVKRGGDLKAGLAGADDGDDRICHQTCVSGK